MKKFIFLSLFFIPQMAMAWGMQGHRVIGEIANRHLTKTAKKNIQKILGNESLAMSANWGDFIKSDSSYDHLDTWHYNNFPGGLSQTQFFAALQNDTAKGAYQAVVWLTGQLKMKSLTVSQQQEYLKLLIHIVGDMHQPMHMGQYEDRGGNRIRVMWFTSNINLHQLWDNRLIEHQKLSFTEYADAINFSTKAERKFWQQQTVADWAFDSYTIAQKIYSEVEPNQKLGYRYNYDYISTLNNQLLKAGIRLAGLLNEIFG